MAGVLDAGFDALASHLSAASLWGVPGLPAEPVHVSVTRVLRRREVAASRIHHLTLVPDGQRAHVHNIPLTGPSLTVLLVCGLEGKYAGGRVLDHMLAARLTTVAETWDVVDRMSKQGRNGLVDLRELLESRSDDDMPAQSNNERRFEEIARRNGLWTLKRQVDIGDPVWIARVDFRDTEVPDLVVEVHSERYHTTTAHRRADAERIARLEASGLTVVVVWDHEIWYEPDRAIQRVLAVRSRLRHGAPTF